jgi:hypothetical protein
LILLLLPKRIISIVASFSSFANQKKHFLTYSFSTNHNKEENKETRRRKKLVVFFF